MEKHYTGAPNLTPFTKQTNKHHRDYFNKLWKITEETRRTAAARQTSVALGMTAIKKGRSPGNASVIALFTWHYTVKTQ